MSKIEKINPERSRIEKMEAEMSKTEKINPEISRIEKMEAEMSKIEKIEAVVSKIEKKIDVLWPQYPEIPYSAQHE